MRRSTQFYCGIARVRASRQMNLYGSIREVNEELCSSASDVGQTQIQPASRWNYVIRRIGSRTDIFLLPALDDRSKFVGEGGISARS